MQIHPRHSCNCYLYDKPSSSVIYQFLYSIDYALHTTCGTHCTVVISD